MRKKKAVRAEPGGLCFFAPAFCYWQFASLIGAIQVDQLNVPFDFRYSVVNQRVQSSLGSTLTLE